MSWISDVKHELSGLDISQISLRKFGLMVGSIFVLIGLVLLIKTNYHIFLFILIFIGIFLFLGGFFKPLILSSIYKIWMGFAFGIGWIISRIILIILFYFVVALIGIISKIFGKSFLDINFKTSKKSLWIKKKNFKSSIEKMY